MSNQPAPSHNTGTSSPISKEAIAAPVMSKLSDKVRAKLKAFVEKSAKASQSMTETAAIKPTTRYFSPNQPSLSLSPAPTLTGSFLPGLLDASISTTKEYIEHPIQEEPKESPMLMDDDVSIDVEDDTLVRSSSTTSLPIRRSRSLSIRRPLGIPAPTESSDMQPSSYRLKSPHYVAQPGDLNEDADGDYDEDAQVVDADDMYDEMYSAEESFDEDEGEEGMIGDKKFAEESDMAMEDSMVRPLDGIVKERSPKVDGMVDTQQPSTAIENEPPKFKAMAVFRTGNAVTMMNAVRTREYPNGIFDIDEQDEFGMSPLHHIVKSVQLYDHSNLQASRESSYEKERAIRYLLSCGADINLPDAKGVTPLQYAALNKQAMALRPFVSHLRKQMYEGDIPDIDVGVPSAATNHHNLVGLLCAGPRSHLDAQMLEFILEAEENCTPAILNVQDKEGRTALRNVLLTLAILPPRRSLASSMAASRRIRTQYTVGMKMLKLLLEAPTSTTIPDAQQRTLLHDVAGLIEICQPTLDLLFSYDKVLEGITMKDRWLDTPLHVACGAQNNLFVQKIIGLDCIDGEARNIRGQTALHVACMYYYNPLMIKSLLSTGKFDAKAVDTTLNTTLHCVACLPAEARRTESAVKETTLWLLAYGARDAQNASGVKAGLMGAQFDNAPFCEALLTFQPNLVAWPSDASQ